MRTANNEHLRLIMYLQYMKVMFLKNAFLGTDIDEH